MEEYDADRPTDCYASKAKQLVRILKLTGTARSLVFSQWTSHLQHLEGDEARSSLYPHADRDLLDTLDDEGITYARYVSLLRVSGLVRCSFLDRRMVKCQWQIGKRQ